jgi:Fe-S-cluster containining protein
MADPKVSGRQFYDCLKCPGYCCSYPIIVVTSRDLARLAEHFGLSEEDTERRFCTARHGYKRIMRRKPDKHFRRICQFFDTTARRCGIYEARPAACRAYPGRPHCGYYDFLSFERAAQNDPDYVSTTHHAED